MMDIHKRQKGTLAENDVCVFLQKKGMRIIKQNFHSYFGEIDLIMQDNDSIVFVEVRSRKNMGFGTAIESVDYRKKQKIIKTALLFLQQEKLLDKVNCRFDVVGVEQKSFQWIKDAFTMNDFTEF